MTHHKGIEGLGYIEGESLLGMHDGIMPDDLLADLLTDLEVEFLASPHKIDNCEICGVHVRCGYCGNNCCNGGTGTLPSGKECGCEEAYSFQDRGILNNFGD